MPSASTVAELAVVINADISGVEKGLTDVGKQVSGFGQSMQSVFSGIGAGIGIKAFDLVVDGIKSATDVAVGFNSKMEQSTIAFTSMLGSAEKAQAFLSDMKQFAATTPFEFPDLLDASKKMLAFGFAASDVRPLLTAVGSAAAAMGTGRTGVEAITGALGQMRAATVVQAGELNQLTEQGVPAFQILADAMGISTGEVKKLASEGKIASDVFITAFQSWASANYGDMMAKQALTFEGAMSTIKDSLTFAVANAFKPFFEMLSDLAVEIAAFVQTAEFSEWADSVAAAIKDTIVVLTDFARYIGAVLEDGDTMNDWLSHLTDSFQAVAFAIGTVTAALAELAPYAKALAGFMWENRDAIMAVGVAFATFVILTTVVGWVTAIAGAIGAVTAAISASGGILAALGALVAILGGPVTLIIAAVAAAVALLAYAWANNWGDIQGKTAAVVDFLSGVPGMVSGFFGAISKTFDDLVTAVTDAWTTVKTTTETVWNGVKTFLEDWWRVILVTLTGPVGLVAVLIIDNWEAIKLATETIFRAIANILTVIWEEIYTQIIKPKVDAVKLYVAETWEGIRLAIEEKMNAVSTLVSTIWEAVKTSTTTVLNVVLAFVRDTIFEPMRAAIDEKITAAKTAFETAITGLKTAAENALNPFLTWWRDTIWEPIRAAADAAMNGENGVVTRFTAAVNGVKSVVDTTMEGIKNAWTTMWGAIETAARSPADALETVTDAVKALEKAMPTWLIPKSPTPFEKGIVRIADAVKVMEDRMRSFSTGAGGMTGEFDDWLKSAIAYTNAPAEWLEPLKWIVAHESGGDPTAKNPKSTATGLFQIIDTTWAGSRDKSLPDEIKNPVINAIAGIRYIKGRYGDPWSAVDFWKSHNHYGVGGWAGLHGPELAWLGERGPEYVVPNAALRGGAGGGDTYIIDARGAQVYDGSRFEDLLVGALEKAERRGRIAPITSGTGRR